MASPPSVLPPTSPARRTIASGTAPPRRASCNRYRTSSKARRCGAKPSPPNHSPRQPAPMAKTIYNLKPAFQNLLRPVATGLYRLGVTANQVTVGAALLSLAAGAVLVLYPNRPRALLVLPPVLFLRMALNAIDGMLAREFGLKSRRGAILDELGDVISDSALYLPLALGWGFSPTLVTLSVLLAVITEMAGVLALMVGAGRRYDGPMGKSDRAFL